MKKFSLRFMILVTFFTITVSGCDRFPLIYENNKSQDSESMNGTPTLPGALEIYPTIMVDGELYRWEKVYNWDGLEQKQDDLPKESIYYGEVTHVEGSIPLNDCEFVSTFPVTGQIYTLSNDSDKVLLYLTTDWLENTIIEFKIVK